MNQISRQLSDATSEGEAKQWGATGTVSDSHSTGGDHQRRNWSRSSTFSRSEQEPVNPTNPHMLLR